jgi:ubiquitin-protein ligase E3 B
LLQQSVGFSIKQHYEGDVEDLCLDFTLTEELGGKRIVHELRPGGKNISVTNENKLHYVHAMADFKLNRQVCYLAHTCNHWLAFVQNQ